MFLFDIGFLNIRILDIIDILIVAYFLYLIYKLLRGTIAFNIIIGVLILYVIWWVVNLLKMQLLILLLGKFVAFGVIILIIIFQPEVRKFLLYLGNSTLKGRFAFLNKFFSNNFQMGDDSIGTIQEIKKALLKMSKDKIGALIVFTTFNSNIINENNGVLVDAKLSKELIESIFYKNSPLHDGAMIVAGKRIQTASAILPVSSNPKIPNKLGTRHRAGIGITEVSNASVFIVSEETGEISFAYGGKLETGLDEKKLLKKLKNHSI